MFSTDFNIIISTRVLLQGQCLVRKGHGFSHLKSQTIRQHRLRGHQPVDSVFVCSNRIMSKFTTVMILVVGKVQDTLPNWAIIQILYFSHGLCQLQKSPIIFYSVFVHDLQFSFHLLKTITFRLLFLISIYASHTGSLNLGSTLHSVLHQYSKLIFPTCSGYFTDAYLIFLVHLEY